MKFLAFRFLLVFSLIFAMGAVFDNAVASEESATLVKQGIEELKKQEHDKALEKFSAAIKADNNDQQAVFFKAVALTRKGDFSNSLPLLKAVKEKGLVNPELDFELGWSQMGVKNWQDALASFESYEKAQPGRGQTMEFMGRCYLFLEQLDKADAAFKEALARDQRLKASVEFYLAMLETKRNNKEAAVKHLTEAVVSDSPYGRALRDALGISLAPVKKAEQKNFGIAVSAVAGYNDNVIGLGNTIPLSGDITHKDSAFERFSANFTYNRPMTNAGVNAGYAFLADTYNSIARANLLDNFVYVDYMRAFSEKLSGSVRVSDEYTLSGGHSYRNQIGLRPALVYRFYRQSATEFFYAYGLSDYMFNNAFAAWNRDGHSDTVGVTHYVYLNNKPLASVGYSHVWNSADGTDYAFESDILSARVSYPLFMNVIGEAGYTYTKDGYSNPNSLSSSGLTRGDHADNFSAQLSRPVYKNVNASIQYQGMRTHSNIEYFTYNQNVWLAGINASW